LRLFQFPGYLSIKYSISEAPHYITGENQGMCKLALASFLINTKE
jgi:hypothetical protein